MHFTHYLSKGRVRNQSSAETVKIGLYNYFWKGSFPDNVLKSSYLFTIFGSDSQSKHVLYKPSKVFMVQFFNVTANFVLKPCLDDSAD